MLYAIKRLPRIGRRHYGCTAEEALDALGSKLGQTVFTGVEAVSQLKQASRLSKPLIVTDRGLSHLGIEQTVTRAYFPTSTVVSNAEPTLHCIADVHRLFVESGADGIIGLGGGGPMDVARAATWLAGVDGGKIIAGYRHAVDALLDFRSIMKEVDASGEKKERYMKALPRLAMIPTTAGTGSDGGKSAALHLPNGFKYMIGHPSLVAPYVALNPSYTESMPPRLTAATAIDALAHSIEAYLVPSTAVLRKDIIGQEGGIQGGSQTTSSASGSEAGPSVESRPGMTLEEVQLCDAFAKRGLDLILTNLPEVMAKPWDLHARLAMQVAALFGAKAFRKGDLGAVHATAHSIGTELEHLHHGEAIARMFVPVFKFYEDKMKKDPEGDPFKIPDSQNSNPTSTSSNMSKSSASSSTTSSTIPSRSAYASPETRAKFKELHATFQRFGYSAPSLSGSIDILLKSLDLPHNLEGLELKEEDSATRGKRALYDSCNTPPIPITENDYNLIFHRALHPDADADAEKEPPPSL